MCDLPILVLASNDRRDTQGYRGHPFSSSYPCLEPFNFDDVAKLRGEKRRDVLESYQVALDVIRRSALEGLADLLIAAETGPKGAKGFASVASSR